MAIYNNEEDKKKMEEHLSQQMQMTLLTLNVRDADSVAWGVMISSLILLIFTTHVLL